MIKTSIYNLDKAISNATREQPRLQAFISELKQKRQEKLEEIRELQAEIDGLYEQEDDYNKLKDINIRCGKVIGRISLWLDSVNDYTEVNRQKQLIKDLENKIKEINNIIDADSVEELDILPMPKGRGFLDTNDTCLLKQQVLLYLSKEG